MSSSLAPGRTDFVTSSRVVHSTGAVPRHLLRFDCRSPADRHYRRKSGPDNCSTWADCISREAFNVSANVDRDPKAVVRHTAPRGPLHPYHRYRDQAPSQRNASSRSTSALMLSVSPPAPSFAFLASAGATAQETLLQTREIESRHAIVRSQPERLRSPTRPTSARAKAMQAAR